MNDAPTREWLTLTEAGNRLGISRRRVNYLLRTGQLRAVPFGRRRVVPVAEVERFREYLAGRAS